MLAIDGRSSSTYVIPGWIYKALLRNKVNNIDIINFNKVKPFLSSIDMAAWIYLNDVFKIMQKPLSSYSLSTLFKESNIKDYYYLSDSSDIADLVSSRLNADNVIDINTDKLFEFVIVNDVIFIVLYDGFNKITGDTEFIKDFLRLYLKTCYQLQSVHTVSENTLYQLYIKLL